MPQDIRFSRHIRGEPLDIQLSRHIRGERAEINIVVGFHLLLLWNNYLKKFWS
jgi:hypothetical protein